MDDSYEAARAAQLKAASRALDPGRPVQMPFGTVPAALALDLRGADSLVHAWDLAQAIGQEMVCDDDLAERYLVFNERTLAQFPPEQTVFAPSTTPPAGATALERLVALLGREVR